MPSIEIKHANKGENPTFLRIAFKDKNNLRLLENLLKSSGKSENEIMLDLNPDWPDKNVAHALKKIVNDPELRIPLLVKWCRDNRHQLESEDMRTMIEVLMFDKTHLIEALRREPLLLDNIHRMIDDHLKSIAFPERFREVLFWVRFAYHVETQALAAFGEVPGHKQRLNELHDTLDAWQKKVADYQDKHPEARMGKSDYFFQAHKTYCLIAGKQSISKEDIPAFFGNYFLMQFFQTDKIAEEDRWVKYDIELSLFKLQKQFQDHLLGNNESLNDTIKVILKGLNIPVRDLKILDVKFPLISLINDKEEIVLDLMKGIFLKNDIEMKAGTWPSALHNKELFKTLLGDPLPLSSMPRVKD